MQCEVGVWSSEIGLEWGFDIGNEVQYLLGMNWFGKGQYVTPPCCTHKLTFSIFYFLFNFIIRRRLIHFNR